MIFNSVDKKPGECTVIVCDGLQIVFSEYLLLVGCRFFPIGLSAQVLTLVAVLVFHAAKGALDLHLHGSGPMLITIAGSGNVNIHIEGDCTGLVTLNIIGSGDVVVYVPMGQSPPQITGGGEYTIVYCNPGEEVEKDEF
jgi:hypothetical protein